MKHGKSYAADPMRASCLEVHQGTFSWCTNYNRTVQGVNFGAFVQCQGRADQQGGLVPTGREPGKGSHRPRMARWRFL